MYFVAISSEIFLSAPILIISNGLSIAFPNPSKILSTAVCDCETISILGLSAVFIDFVTTCPIISFITFVFPVPGGPCINPIFSEFKAFMTACCCDVFSFCAINLGSNIVGISSGSSTFNKISFKFRAEYSSLFNDLIAFI